MKSAVVSIIAIICLTILGIFITYTQPEASKLLYAIVSVIAGIAGYSIPKAVMAIRRRRAQAMMIKTMREKNR